MFTVMPDAGHKDADEDAGGGKGEVQNKDSVCRISMLVPADINFSVKSGCHRSQWPPT